MNCNVELSLRENIKKMKYHIIAIFVICLILGTGLAAAGTLTVSLAPSLDSKGDIIMATSITKAELLRMDYNSTVTKVTGTVAGFTALFNLSGIAPGDYFIRVNGLTDNLIPTRIDDPTKDTNQFVGENLQVSIIGNLSDPTYQIKMLTKTHDVPPRVWCSDGTSVVGEGTSVYIIQSLKTKPQKLEIKYVVLVSSEPTLTNITDYTPAAPIHPSTMTSLNPPFSQWVFRHGIDYGGDDSKCNSNSCHGNLNTIPANLNTKNPSPFNGNFIEIPVNKGFCYRCHYGKSGTEAGWVGEPGCEHSYPTTTPTAIPTTPTPKTPAFEALFAISALLMAILVKRR
jgi:hypothetical protein